MSRPLRGLALLLVAAAACGGSRGGSTQKTPHPVSPFGRVPTYTADIAPLVAARCGRCHATGVAHDLTSYDALSAESDAVRAAVGEGRMPPDFRLDGVSRALILAWIDGDTPR